MFSDPIRGDLLMQQMREQEPSLPLIATFGAVSAPQRERSALGSDSLTQLRGRKAKMNRTRNCPLSIPIGVRIPIH